MTTGKRSTRIGLIRLSAILVVSKTLLFAKIQIAGAATSETSSSALCATEKAACEDDAACNACMESHVQESSSSVCSARYPDAFEKKCAGYEGCYPSYCASNGAYACCGFIDNAAASECMTNPAAAGLWTCLEDEEACGIEYMPCYIGDSDANATPPPTSSPASSPSSRTISPTFSSSPSPGSPASSLVSPSSNADCAAEQLACANNVVCNACAESYVEKSSAAVFSASCYEFYPGSFFSFCSSSGAHSCCGFTDNNAAIECMTNAEMVDLWSCSQAEKYCEVDDMPCYSGVLTESDSSVNGACSMLGSSGTLLATGIVVAAAFLLGNINIASC